jgi:hypothetical protein
MTPADLKEVRLAVDSIRGMANDDVFPVILERL